MNAGTISLVIACFFAGFSCATWFWMLANRITSGSPKPIQMPDTIFHAPYAGVLKFTTSISGKYVIHWGNRGWGLYHLSEGDIVDVMAQTINGNPVGPTL